MNHLFHLPCDRHSYVWSPVGVFLVTSYKLRLVRLVVCVCVSEFGGYGSKCSDRHCCHCSQIFLSQVIMPGKYLMTGTAYVLMARTLFLPFSCLFRICLTLCRYLVVADLFVASSWLPFTSGIPRYLHCPQHLLQCPLAVQPLQSWSPCFSLI